MPEDSPVIGAGARERPFLTIITPTIDDAQFIDDAVACIPAQEQHLVEHIIVHDGSAAFTRRLAGLYPWLRLIAGEGRGATAAVALGTAVATGEFVFYLASDDRLVTGALLALAEAASARPEVDVWTGGTRIFASGPDGREQTVRALDDPETIALKLANVLDDIPLMTARFVRREVYARVGAFDLHFSACSDREFALRMLLAGVREGFLRMRVSELRMHAGSATLRRPGQRIPSYLDEHIALAWQYVADPGITPSLRAAMRDWHARETLRKAYYALRAGETANALRSVGAALMRDPIWPLRARTAFAAHRLRLRGLVRS